MALNRKDDYFSRDLLHQQFQGPLFISWSSTCRGQLFGKRQGRIIANDFWRAPPNYVYIVLHRICPRLDFDRVYIIMAKIGVYFMSRPNETHIIPFQLSPPKPPTRTIAGCISLKLADANQPQTNCDPLLLWFRIRKMANHTDHECSARSAR